jgi:hypothetical protein
MPPKSSNSRRRSRLSAGRQPSIERLEDRALLAAAPLTSTPDLVPGSDSGWSREDNKTSITMPTFAGTAAGAVVVSLFDGKAFIGSAPVVSGMWSFTVPSPLANGRHVVSARAWAAGATQPGASSAPLTVTVNASAPLPTTVALAPAADSGLKGDGRTNVAAPTLVGRAQPGTIISFTLFQGRVGTYAGAVGVPATGSWRFRLPSLADGNYTVTTSVENAFGLRTAGASLPLTIDTIRPVATISNFANLDTITLSFTKPVTNVTLRSLWIAGTSRELGAIPPMSLADPRVKMLLGPGAISITPASPGYSQTYTIKLSLAFSEPGSYSLTLLGAGLGDWAGNRPGNAVVGVTVA